MESENLTIAQNSAINYINTLLNDETFSPAYLKSTFDEINATNETTRRLLEQQLFAVTQEAPIEIDKSLSVLTSVDAVIKKFSVDEDQLVGDVCNSVADMSPLVAKLSALTAQIRELEKYSRYLSCIAHIEDLSSDIQSAILIKAIDQAVAQFGAMVDFGRIMSTTQCNHLLDFVKKSITYWYKILLEKLCSEFDETLKAWQWPFITATVKVAPVLKSNELKEQFGSSFQNLVNLYAPDDLLTDKVTCPSSITLPDDIQKLPLPIQVLLKPFQKRFRYHFFTNEQTNKPDKPEWYFTQTLTWIHDHEDFLKTRVQPEFDNTGFNRVNAVMEFVRGLVVFVMSKIFHDLALIKTDNQLAHLVDETLLFHRELRNRYDYPDALRGCLHVFIESEPFRWWISIEEKFALEKMDSMLSSDTKWHCQYKNIADIDDSKVSECGETFVTLLNTITDRFRFLPSIKRQLQFVNLQLELLDDFRVRLIQIRSEMQTLGTCPLHPHYCSILNTVGYIIGILQQWTNQPFFVKLQYFKQQNDKQNSIASEVTASQQDKSVFESNNSGTSRLDERSTRADDSHEVFFDFTGNEDLIDTVDASLFDELINLFQLLQDAMLSDIESYVFDDVKARSKPYRREKWLALPSQKDYLSLALSNSACEMLHVLKDHLHQMELLLSKSLFTLFWQRLAADLDKFLYKQLIQANHFNEGGAAQLQFDMTRNLFPLFGAYTTKPENFFKDVKESCMVLSLSAGSVLLLRDVLHVALHQRHEAAPATDPFAALHDIGVFKLDLEEVEYLLSRRADL